MTDNLLACPFCGGEAEIRSRESTEIRCANDQCIIGDPAPFNDFSHKADAITAWNRRTNNHAELVEALPDDVRRLVIAARVIAFNDWDGDSEEWVIARKELDDASEAFAARVPWENDCLPPHADQLGALRKIACLDDTPANTYLEATGSYSLFDEPGSVEIARKALSLYGGEKP